MSDLNLQTITFYPATKRGNGTGHLFRCLRSARALLDRSEDRIVSVLITPERDPDSIDVDSITAMFPEVPLIHEIPVDSGVIVLDRRKTKPEFYDRLPPELSVIALDEEGPILESAEFTVNMLGPDKVCSNVNVLPPLPLHRRVEKSAEINNILVTFGGEDPAGLTKVTIDALLVAGFSSDRITVLQGPSFSCLDLPDTICVRPADPDLPEILADYDLVITSYGLTAFEAVAAGCHLGIVDPTRYHARLSRAASFYRLGVREIHTGKLRRLLVSGSVGRSDGQRCLSSETGTEDLSTVISGRRFGVDRCPVCGSRRNRVIERLPFATFYSCACSGLVYRVGMEPDEMQYDESYFNEEYRARYGRTYLEDFEAIRKLSSVRIERIRNIASSGFAGLDHLPLHPAATHDSSSGEPTLLDVGCAYGPFLVEASERGFETFGVDISHGAIDFVKGTLGLRGACSDVISFDPDSYGYDRFDVVTMWYVIEHFEKLDEVLDKVRSLLAPGGIFAFATPNLAGISGKSNRSRFLRQSPRDHYSVFTPDTASQLLSQHGFVTVDIEMTGHHPERFPVLGRVKRLKRILGASSVLFGLGDTFEIYARFAGEDAT